MERNSNDQIFHKEITGKRCVVVNLLIGMIAMKDSMETVTCNMSRVTNCNL